MITENILRDLLNRNEDKTIDFKKEPHRLDNNYFKSNFIKDILAMANTPRNETAYIVIGVKAYPDGTKDLVGVTQHPDDNDLQTIINDSNKKVQIEPRPSFVYYPINLEGLSYGIIEIPTDKKGPFSSTKDYEKVKAKHLYYRRGSQNAIATHDEEKEIYDWFLSLSKATPQIESRPIVKHVDISNWNEFYQECHYFDKNRLYIYIVGKLPQIHPDELQPFAKLPISLVLDFDQLTNETGIYSAIKDELNNYNSVHLLTLGDVYNLVPQKACYWYAARGLKGRDSSLVEDEWRKWNQKYGRELRILLSDFAKASNGRLLTVVCAWYAPEYARTICSIIDESFRDSAEYIFAVPEADRFEELSQQFTGRTFSISFEQILHGIPHYIPGYRDDFKPDAGIPRIDGTLHNLSNTLLNWLHEDLEILHSSIDLELNEEQENDYLQGAMITWNDLDSHYDVTRDDKIKIQKLVERELSKRTASRLNLYHWPGSGGTTVARRIGWDLRQKYPVVMLNRVAVRDTVERFRELFRITENPILAVVEGADVIPENMDILYNEVKAEQIPVVFLSVTRTFKKSAHGKSERSRYLGKTLSNDECFHFVKAFKRIVPEKETQLNNILQSDSSNRTPFYFALTAFDRNFVGLNHYVKIRLHEASPIQRELLTYIAFAYYYGHKSVLSQIFASYLGYSGRTPLRLEKVLDSPQLELLVQVEDCKWRPAHNLIAEEILITRLSENTERRNWKWNLSDLAINFIKICSEGVLLVYNDLIDSLRRIFILRDERELLGTEASYSTHFAHLLDDIPNQEGALIVLKELVKSFPDEAHFWGHLGRYYSVKMEEPDDALEAIEQAISLSPHEDTVLYHMKGMGYRKKIYDQMRRFKQDDNIQKTDIEELQNTVELAIESFNKARNIDPNSEHNYISAIQLLLRTLDFGFKISGYESRTDFLVAPSSTWYRENLDLIENLMYLLRSTKEGERVSQYEERCQADLYNIYDNYERALERWNNLLSRRDIYAPPVRRLIVQAYLNRKQNDWSSMSSSEIDRIVGLLEDNLKEEPGSDHNIRLWFQAIRYSSEQNIDMILDRVATWKTIGDSMDAYFYLYITHVLKAIDGSTIEREKSEELIKQSSEKARYRRNRTRTIEWLGKGTDLRRLMHYSELGRWDRKKEFYENKSKLERINGYIHDIKGPEAGIIELYSCGLSAFFVPAKAKIKDREAGATKNHLNLKVS
jgi:tetratricopeptide (TPR) repeat protein